MGCDGLPLEFFSFKYVKRHDLVIKYGIKNKHDYRLKKISTLVPNLGAEVEYELLIRSYKQLAINTKLW